MNEALSNDPFVAAGEAAQLLEDMGFVAVAKKADGRITLECFRRDGAAHGVRMFVPEATVDPSELAEQCRLAMEQGEEPARRERRAKN
jgi:hypothetical protein